MLLMTLWLLMLFNSKQISLRNEVDCIYPTFSCFDCPSIISPKEGYDSYAMALGLSAEFLCCSMFLILSSNKIGGRSKRRAEPGPRCQGPLCWGSTSAVHCGTTQPHRTSHTYVGSPCHQGAERETLTDVAAQSPPICFAEERDSAKAHQIK